MDFYKAIGTVAMLLVVVGGLNWGLVGFFGYDLVSSIFGSGSGITKLVYDLVGLSAIYVLFKHLMDGSKG